MNKLVLRVVGGLGNQLFMVFNAISLSIDYNLELIIDETVYDERRPSIKNYNIFKSNNIIIDKIEELGNLNFIKQHNFYYSKINIQPKNNYILNSDLYDYYQSYKFFWHNVDKIKNYINIDINLINHYKSTIKSLGKHIAIHIRLTDYVSKKDFHQVVDINYYINILSNYNLENYKILLFSDDYESAIQMLLPHINIDNIILAKNYSFTDENQLYLLSCTNIRICPNSSYALWSCYFNDMYNFSENPTYYFPSKWFGPCAYIDYIIEDIIPVNNSNYKIIGV